MKYTGSYFVTSGPLALVLALVPGRWVAMCIYCSNIGYLLGIGGDNCNTKSELESWKNKLDYSDHGERFNLLIDSTNQAAIKRCATVIQIPAWVLSAAIVKSMLNLAEGLFGFPSQSQPIFRSFWQFWATKILTADKWKMSLCMKKLTVRVSKFDLESFNRKKSSSQATERCV